MLYSTLIIIVKKKMHGSEKFIGLRPIARALYHFSSCRDAFQDGEGSWATYKDCGKLVILAINRIFGRDREHGQIRDAVFEDQNVLYSEESG
jgi:hypothetical protein